MTTEFDISSLFTRSRVLAVDDSGEHQRIRTRGFRNEEFTEVVSNAPHGFASNAPADSVGYFMRFGSSDRLMAMGQQTKNRLKNLPTGAAALYDADGNVIFARMANGITIKPAAGKNVYLGGDGPGDGAYAKVMTESGPSINVYARIG